MDYLNSAWLESTTRFVASNMEEALEYAKELLELLKGHQILDIHFYKEVWIKE